jgi:Uma2 family endonuclease
MTAVVPQRDALEFPEPVVLTAREYDALPPSSRIELVDGVVQVMTPATARHQEIVDAIKAALRRACPDTLRAVREQEVRLGEVHRRNPDVMVVRAEAFNLDSYSYQPRDVILAVEVVSPGSPAIDRLHKPAEYAVAGIEHFWRVEILPALTVITYRLVEPSRYTVSGRFTEGDTVAAPGLPWAKISVADLAP